MPETNSVRIFISSPADVRPERLIAARVIARLDREYVHHFHVEAVLWERQPLLATEHFQAGITPPRETDIVVVILWSRLGVQLPADRYVGALSGKPVTGTEWEFEDAVHSWRTRQSPQPLVYRKTTEPVAGLHDADIEERRRQLALVENFIRRWFFNEADGSFTSAFHSVVTPAEFEERLYDHLHTLLDRKVVGEVTASVRWLRGSPFRGLGSFEYEHAQIFFGRTRARNELREILERQIARGSAFVLMLGASGSGKSSLVKAGLVPDLKLPGMVGRVALCRHCVVRPSDLTEDMFAGLARALLDDSVLPEIGTSGLDAAALAAALRSAPDEACRKISEGLSRAGAAARLTEIAEARLLLVVDQLEELFAPEGPTPAEREQFVALLEALARSGVVWVVATMRSDFFDRLEELPRLARIADGEGRYLLLPPDGGEIGQMIRQPAREAGVRFEVDEQNGIPLDEVIREAAATDRESLPLLSFLLDQLWQHGKADGLLTYDTYEALGGLEGALGRRADELFEAQPPEVRAALPQVLRELVSVGHGETGATARPAALNQFAIGSPERCLVEAFLSADARLLVADSGPDGQPRVRVAHEALLSHWDRARRQIEQDRDDIRTRTLIEQAEAEWRSAQSRAKAALLLRNPRLASAVDLARRWGNGLAPGLRTFIAQSESAAKAATRRRWAIAAVIMLALATLAAASTGALYIAEVQRNTALMAQSSFLARDARNAVAEGNATLGILLALAALPRDLDKPDRPFLKDAAFALEQAYANRRERLILSGHDGSVEFVALSPDGKRAITAGGKIPRIWDVATGTTTAMLQGHEDNVLHVEFSPDGKRLATASGDKTARVWDSSTGASLAVFRMQASVTVAIFSPDGTRLATTATDGSVQLWNAMDGELITALVGHRRSVGSAVFSPDGQRIVTTSSDGTARLWDGQTGTAIAVLQRGGMFAAFSHDATRVVTIGAIDQTPQVWDGRTGGSLVTLRHPQTVLSAAFSADGAYVITAARDGIRFWDATGHARYFRGGGYRYAAFSSNGRWLFVTESPSLAAGQIFELEIRPTTPLAHKLGVIQREGGFTNRGVHNINAAAAAFSPDGRRLLTGASGRIAVLWDVEPGATAAILDGHQDELHSVAFSPDDKRLVTASADKTARIWDGQTGAPLAVLRGHTGALNSASFSPDGTRVITASDDRTAGMWSVDGTRVNVLQGHQQEVLAASFSPDGKQMLTASRDKTARLWDSNSGTQIGSLNAHDNAVTAAVFAPDGTRILTASFDGIARLWDANARTTINTLDGHQRPADRQARTFAGFSTDGARAFTILQNPNTLPERQSSVRIWDTKSGSALGERLTIPNYFANRPSASVSADGKRVRHQAVVHDVDSGRVLAGLKGHRDHVYSGAFSPDGTRVVTVSKDETARLWETETGALITTLEGHRGEVYTAAFSSDGTRIVTTSSDKTARLWSVKRCQALIDAARRDLPRDLSAQERARYFLDERPPGAATRIYTTLRAWFAFALPQVGDSCI